MRLNKSEHAIRGKGITKFSLKCDDDKDKWFNLIDILYKADNFSSVILKGLYDNRKDIVLKAGILNSIDKEFEISKELKDLPNFIRYYCKFVCFDNIKKIIKNEGLIGTYYLCKSGREQIGILAMNYYKLGSIGSYPWNENNINVLKNVLKHTVYTYLNAYLKLGFIHGDLHADNVLIKEKTVCEIDYYYKKLPVDAFEIRIMDFEKSKINKNFEFILVLNDIHKLLNSVCMGERYTVKFEYKNKMLRKMKNSVLIENVNVCTFDNKYFDELNLIIESLYVFSHNYVV